MATELLDEHFTLPLDYDALASGEPMRVAQAVEEMVRALQEQVYWSIATRMNLALQQLGQGGSTGSIHIGGSIDPDTGIWTDNTWRLRPDGETLYLEIYDADTAAWQDEFTWSKTT